MKQKKEKESWFKKYILLVIIALLLVFVGLLALFYLAISRLPESGPSGFSIEKLPKASPKIQQEVTVSREVVGITQTVNTADKNSQNETQAEVEENQETETEFADPLTNMNEREIIKPYGIFITPQNSPVSPEKFTGFHNGLDLEALPDEAKDTPLFAICTGAITRKTTATGYGGYIVQECEYDNKTLQVLYGHVDLGSVVESTIVEKGEQIAVLGEGFSNETDGERKHLHLAIQQEGSLDIRGYVQNENELSKWLDPQEILPLKK